MPSYVEIFLLDFELPEAPLEEWLVRFEFDFIDCYRLAKSQGPVCALISMDIDQNGLDDLLFINIYLKMFSVLQTSEGSWSPGPELLTKSNPTHRNLLKALRQGKIQITPPVWNNLIIGEVLYKVD